MDSLGIGLDCSGDMQEVRRREGPPDDVRSSELAGDHTEQWYYFVGGRPARVYTFRWGASYESCEASGPAQISRIMLPSR